MLTQWWMKRWYTRDLWYVEAGKPIALQLPLTCWTAPPPPPSAEPPYTYIFFKKKEREWRMLLIETNDFWTRSRRIRGSVVRLDFMTLETEHPIIYLGIQYRFPVRINRWITNWMELCAQARVNLFTTIILLGECKPAKIRVFENCNLLGIWGMSDIKFLWIYGVAFNRLECKYPTSLDSLVRKVIDPFYILYDKLNFSHYYLHVKKLYTDWRTGYIGCRCIERE